jgi:hypothetical protein
MNSTSELDRLSALIPRERDALLYRWREQVRELPSAEHLDAPTLNDHVPQLIDELEEVVAEYKHPARLHPRSRAGERADASGGAAPHPEPRAGRRDRAGGFAGRGEIARSHR